MEGHTLESQGLYTVSGKYWSFLPVLLNELTGFTLTCIHIDVLHTVDQGVASHIVGNCLVECSKSLGPNQKKRMHALAEKVKKWYAENHSTSKLQGKLTW